MNSINYLEKAKKKLGMNSDYSLAKYLGISRMAVSNLKAGKRTMDAYTAARLAEALEIDPMEIIAAAEEEREKDERKREFWREMVRKIASGAVCLALLLGWPLPGSEAAKYGQSTHYPQLFGRLRRLVSSLANRWTHRPA